MIYYILVKTQSESVLILEKVIQDESLQNLVKNYLLIRKVKNVGRQFSLFGRGTIVKPFEGAAFKLRKGEITTSHLRQNLDII
jgi:peptidyl-prolyl cis-trans isomerase C